MQMCLCSCHDQLLTMSKARSADRFKELSEKNWTVSSASEVTILWRYTNMLIIIITIIIIIIIISVIWPHWKVVFAVLTFPLVCWLYLWFYLIPFPIRIAPLFMLCRWRYTTASWLINWIIANQQITAYDATSAYWSCLPHRNHNKKATPVVQLIDTVAEYAFICSLEPPRNVICL